MPPKGFECLQNKFYRHFIPFLLNSCLLSEPIFEWEVAFVLFSKTPHIRLGLRSGFKSCLIAVLTIFSWTFNSLTCFLIDAVGVFYNPSRLV